MIIDTIPQLKKLSNSEKLLLINELWESLSLQEDALPVPDSHKKYWTNVLESMKRIQNRSLHGKK